MKKRKTALQEKWLRSDAGRNDMLFHVGIGAEDLMGEPKVGRRFKGQIWMQGAAKFVEG